MNQKENARQASACWLRYGKLTQDTVIAAYNRWSRRIVMTEKLPRILTAAEELSEGIQGMLGWMPERMVSTEAAGGECIVLCTLNETARVGGLVAGSAPLALEEEGFLIKRLDDLPSAEETGGGMLVAGKTDRGVLYGVFRLLQMMQRGEDLSELFLLENPAGTLRMLNQWDNMDGTIERGYAGRSIFYDDNRIRKDKSGIRQYARLLASTGINGIVINNVNVRGKAGELLTAGLLPEVAEIADIFGKYGIRVFMSINFASPMRLGGLDTADPESPAVRTWWNTKAEELYRFIPEFGGFLVKADSEFNPGPYAYNRTHAQGANMLAQALAPHDGLVIWRCFVYNCLQDWRDRKTDRARAAYDNFMPLDGAFADNVVLQIKNGPMDFQVREPVSPLLGAMKHTNQIVEFQVTQEYTGQQKHLCYLVPQWKRVLSFDTHAKGPGSTVGKVVDGTLYQRNNNGFAAVSNIGDDDNWTGHPLAQANLYGFGRLAWNPDLKAEDIAREWIALTFAHHESVMEPVLEMLMSSWPVYEAYTVPLGIGWMVNPNHHYGPNVDGYEYDKWGTYHRADLHGIGVDRTRQIGTGYTGQYFEPNATQFESLTDCPEELLLFFHHVAYTHRLRSGKTLIQHIYDTHFEGVEAVERMLDTWSSLEGLMDPVIHRNALARFQTQVVDAAEWRDVINTYFYRKTGIPDEKGRKIY